MFAFVVKYLGFLKSIPMMGIFYDSLIKIWVLATKPKLLDWIDEIEEMVLQLPDTSISVHKYGGAQFNFKDKEFAHLHSNGLLDVLFNRKLKAALLQEGKIQEHHVFKESGWISFYIRTEVDSRYAKKLLKIAYHK